MMTLNEILQVTADRLASDVHLHVGLPPMIRFQGELQPIEGAETLRPDRIREFAEEIFKEGQKERFEAGEEIDTGHSLAGVGRFRANIFRQRGTVGIALRRVNVRVPEIEELGLPATVDYLTRFHRGLVLVTGMTGSGKSTTLAAMVGRINATRRCHIVTLEDPIEFLHHDQASIVSQREIGQDTRDFPTALRSVIRQDPDVILIGEMRDAETIRTALTAAETGHLVLSTLHTTSAPQTIERILEYFELEMRLVIRRQMVAHLRGIISQRLVPRLDGQGMIAAIEVLLMNPVVQKKILEDKLAPLKSIMHCALNEGMQTFDQHLVALYQGGLISFESARDQSSNPDSFHLYCQGFFSDIVQNMEG